MFHKSAIVCAHPDDEVLWFSSLLDKVDKVIICFLGIRSDPKCRLGRQMTLKEYPLRNICCLELDEAETFYGVDWENPVITEYGIEIADKRYPDSLYKENYSSLRSLLTSELKGCLNVFTHNPWGEYGSDEHIQIHKVLTDLQKTQNFHVWFPNYVSNKSYKMMLNYIDTLTLSDMRLPTNKELSGQIKHLYQKNGCWTWYDDWQWFGDESFLRHQTSGERAAPNRVFPMNFIKVWMPHKRAGKFRLPGFPLLQFSRNRS
jgi:hypothetical protein